jgi:hypothetical protein
MKVSQEISALCCSERPLRSRTASAFNTHVARRCLHANDTTRDAPCTMCKTHHQLSPASSISADTDHIQRKWETWPSNSGRLSASSRVFPLECQGKMAPQRHLDLPLFYVHRHQPLLGDSSSAVPPSSRKRCECCPSIPAFRSFSRRAVFTGVHFTSQQLGISIFMSVRQQRHREWSQLPLPDHIFALSRYMWLTTFELLRRSCVGCGNVCNTLDWKTH